MSSVLFDIKDHVASITLNRPEKYNALNRDMALAIQDRLDECKASTIRSVLLTGGGKAFCSGQDLEEVSNPESEVDVTVILKEHFNPIVKKIRRLEKPVIAAVNGVAAGAGANIALCSDLIVASKSASFIQVFSKIGLIPDSGGTYFLPRLVGWQKAAALFMFGEKLPAEEAERIGMIYKVLNDDNFQQEAFEIARSLAQMPTKALAFTKQALNNSLVNNYEDQLQDEEILQERAGRTSDYKEGVQAFLEKRKPNFTGE